MKRARIYRVVLYVFGLVLLAFGLTLNTKVGLGAAPVISVPLSIATIWGFDLGNTTMILYMVFVIIALILHAMQLKQSKSIILDNNNAAIDDIRNRMIMDLMQFPLSLLFTRFLNLFASCLPSFETMDTESFAGSLIGRILFLCLGILASGIGIAMSLTMRLIPNPADGVVQTIADQTGKSVGFTKNCFDLLHIFAAVIIGLIFARRIIGIGIGTIAAMLFVGRVIAIFQFFCGAWMLNRSGLQQADERKSELDYKST